MVNHKNCYATHKTYAANFATPFRIRLKRNARLLTQRPSKVPIHYRVKLNNLLKALEKPNRTKWLLLKGLPNFFTKQMSSFFKTFVEQGIALVYTDDILILSNSKKHMFQLIEAFHFISTEHNVKLAQEKIFVSGTQS